MSTINGKHWYRFTFLKSEEWQSFRLGELVKAKAACCICGKEDIKNDVHHIYYGETNTESSQVAILCRKCHDAVHDQMPETSRPKSDKERQLAIKAFRDLKTKLAREEKLRKFGHGPYCHSCKYTSLSLRRYDPLRLEESIHPRTMMLCVSCINRISQHASGLCYSSDTEGWNCIRTIVRCIRVGAGRDVTRKEVESVMHPPKEERIVDFSI